MTQAEALRLAGARLEPIAGSGRFDATLLLEHAVGRERSTFLWDGERELSASEAAAFEALVERRMRGVPVAQLLGTAGFYGLTYEVDEQVLIPRPETEHLVEIAVADVRERGIRTPRIADIGTGSGAIAIALASALPDAWVFGSDISRAAIDIARRNAARNNVYQTCTFVLGDLATPLVPFAPFDIILANLPYIPSADVPQRPDPAGYDPHLALDGGPDGLDLYRRLLPTLPGMMASGGLVLLEAAPPTMPELLKLAGETFGAAAVRLGRDYAGQARYVIARVGAKTD
jgi:release factor glutamine methyltransferase